MDLQNDDTPPTRREPFIPSDAAPRSGPRSAPRPEIKPFFVDIEYIEPDYAASTQSEPRTYSFRFLVRTASAERAMEIARQQFEETQRVSWVSWERRITAVRCAPA
jgi:hypothetical protein